MKKLLAAIMLLAIPAGAIPGRINLQAWYDGYNEMYFNNSLPKNTVVRWGEDGERMGITIKSQDTYYILISLKYNPAERGALLTLLHESCHVATLNEFDDHGIAWKKCMHMLADKGAFDELW